MTIVVGLTGGIASGKSTVSAIFREMNIPVIDADQIAKEVVQNGRVAYSKIVEAFGKEILQEDLEINRAALGQIIFHNEQERQKLNSIVHPEVRSEMLKQKEQLIAEQYQLVVLDIPLLFESKLTYLVDQVIVVHVNELVQLERLQKRNNLSKEDALARIKSQLPLTEKAKMADFIIDNNGSIDETKEQVIKLVSKLTN
ncbi:dephospho-CoA kinase [Priestia flexa]|jgi:dephospho-CoA kinase|uniref:Dephospho-CoA kinase n=2 Tax=Priestia TaxID=2800373 RepID=A0A0V8JKZ6_9BACI|nr:MULTISPECIES: dephospho-CoA kinase [Bacillaceae]AQX53525.1 dephospho-CoA kinase [Priestia flexa]KSU87641.1 dephospho-CoA kinase [Priestia veravalensis]KZB92737.1 dephospho-CoA kinase [Bacillus sp. VT 712]MBN8250661.1 dephospho-CoA kinase [Priestia flexa]MBN8432517.1 dephospho-CoA kinase [Priestia flexa]